MESLVTLVAQPTKDPEQYITYNCGHCSRPVKLKVVNKETILCKECGHRILYKQRIGTVEYLAR
jgi:DNA-directed RNA polymerase subunit RPC12/RpoP